MLEKDDIETSGMVYFEIVEALMASAVSDHYYKQALNLLIPLVKSKNFSLAAIWLKHAECLTHLQMFDQVSSFDFFGFQDVSFSTLPKEKLSVSYCHDNSELLTKIT